MSVLRIGTRGSDLALWQTRWVIAELQKMHTELKCQEVILKTHGDVNMDQLYDPPNTPIGWFTSAIEKALIEGEIDCAVHSYKDLPSSGPDELVIAAVPPRAAAHDVIVTNSAVELEHLPSELRIGTSSPRRRAQLQHYLGIEGIDIRGNVPTRVAKVTSGELDGVVLAAAGILRLNLHVPHMIDLPMDRFVPAPRQGALAVQARRNSEAQSLLSVLDDAASSRSVEAERAFLAELAAGCHTPVGAIAHVDGGKITLCGQLFSDDGKYMVEKTQSGDNPIDVGTILAQQLAHELQVTK